MVLGISWSISHQQTQQTCIISTARKARPIDSSFASILDDVKRLLRTGDSGNNAGITWAFSSSIICMLPDEILKFFPSVMTISHNLLGVSISVLSSVFFLEQSLLASVSQLWPDMIIPGMETTLLLFIVKSEEMMPVQFLVILWILRNLITVDILMQVNLLVLHLVYF